MQKSLPLVKLGNSALQVSKIGYGCMGLSIFYGQPVAEEEGLNIIGKALDQGVTLFDTAHFYGDNEFLIGKAIKKFGRDKFKIATKVPPYQIFKDGSRAKVFGGPENIKKFCYESLKRLDIDQIDLYYQHRIEQSVPIELQAQAFKELIEEGKIKYYGISEASENTIRRAHKIHPLSAVQEEYSLFTRDVENNGVLNACKELGITLVAYSPLGRGILTGQIKKATDLDQTDNRHVMPRFQGENLDKNLQRVEKLNQIAEKLSLTPSQLALAWLVNKHDNVVPIPGTRREKYLKLNNDAGYVSLNQEQIQELDELFPAGSGEGERYPEQFLQHSCADTPTLEQYKQQQQQ